MQKSARIVRPASRHAANTRGMFARHTKTRRVSLLNEKEREEESWGRKREPKIGGWVTLRVLTFRPLTHAERRCRPPKLLRGVSVMPTRIPRVFADGLGACEKRGAKICMPIRRGVLELGSHSAKNINPNKLQKYPSSTTVLVTVTKPFRGWFGVDWSGWSAQELVFVSTQRFSGSGGRGRGPPDDPRPPTPTRPGARNGFCTRKPMPRPTPCSKRLQTIR